MKHLRWKTALIIYTFGIFIILYLAYSAGIPGFIGVIPYYDLIAHFFLYAIWSFLGYQAFSKKLAVPLVLTGFTIIEEVLQMLSVNRTFSLLDLGFSLLGIWLAIYLAKQ